MEVLLWFYSLLSPSTWAKIGVGLIGFIGAILGSTAGAALHSYFSERGKHLATKHDLKELHSQLSANTEITKSIETKITSEELLRRSELEFREKQLSELYGPIYSYLMSQRHIVELWREGKMDDKNFEVKTILSEQNKIMRDLVYKNTHLVYGDRMPEFFVQFFTNTVVWDLYAASTPHGALPDELENDPRTEYSLEFDKHIKEVTEKLKRRIEQLHFKYTFSPESIETLSVDGLSEAELAREKG